MDMITNHSEDKMVDRLEKSIQDGIDINNCGFMEFIEEDEYYILVLKSSDNERKYQFQIWKDEMSSNELFEKFLYISEAFAKQME